MQHYVLPVDIIALRLSSTDLFLSPDLLQIRELEPLLCQPGQASQVIWTSSSNAHRSAFSLEDLQHQRGTEPYSSSKYASDMLSVALNRKHNQQVGTQLTSLPVC